MTTIKLEIHTLETYAKPPWCRSYRPLYLTLAVISRLIYRPNSASLPGVFPVNVNTSFT